MNQGNSPQYDRWAAMCYEVGIPDDDNALVQLLDLKWPEKDSELVADSAPRSLCTVAELSVKDRTPVLVARVIRSMARVGFEFPEEVSLCQYFYRFAMSDGEVFDMHYNRHGEPSSFDIRKCSEGVAEALRRAFQLNLGRPAPADRVCWSTSRQRELQLILADRGWKGLFVDHWPWKTYLCLRRTRYRPGARTPGLVKGSRAAHLILQHSGDELSQIVEAGGDSMVVSILRDAMNELGLIA